MNRRNKISEQHEQDVFSIILCENKRKKSGISRFSTANAAKPLTYFGSLFGLILIRYSKNNILKVTFYSKLYTLLLMITLFSVIVKMKPQSWHYTENDIPLNILTKAYGMIHTGEALYIIFITCFSNSPNYVELFKSMQRIDAHFGTSKKIFWIKRIFCLFLITGPIIQTSYTFFLVKFNINNLSVHFNFFLILLQGSFIVFFMLNIYLKHIMLNYLLIVKTHETIPDYKSVLYKKSIFNVILTHMLREPLYIENKTRRYSWLELMQIYDKLSDCIYVFNKIYSCQVFIMFINWLQCTLLVVCRTLSPTVKHSEVIANDLIMYFSINSRPLFLTQMCQSFITERQKTLTILANHLVRGDLDNEYCEQVQTMIDLVEIRKLEVTGNVFTVDVRTVLNFSGRAVSYAVLMIQYFYIHMFLNLK